MNGPLATSLPAARSGHCMVNFEDKIFSTGGVDENDDATSNVWQFNPANNFAKADGPEMNKKRYWHGCGIVHSIHHGSRPLLVVAGSGTYGGATGGSLKVYKLILNSTAFKNPKNNYGSTPLHSAARGGHFELFQFIVEKLENKNPIDHGRFTTLHHAAFSGNLELCKYLMKMNNAKNPINNYEETPVSYTHLTLPTILLV